MTDIYIPQDTRREQAQEFSDADSPSATAINPLAEAAFDTANYAANRLGVERVVSQVYVEKGPSSAQLAITTSNVFGTDDLELASVGGTDGDIIEILGSVPIQCDVSQGVELRMAVRIGGGAPIAGPVFRAEVVTSLKPIPIFGRMTFVMGGTAAVVVYLQIRNTDNAASARIYQPMTMRVRRIRTNT